MSIGSIETKVGSSLLLNAQLYDGSDSMPKKIFVQLTYPSGTLLEPLFEIPHVIDGDFRDESRSMPDFEYVTAQYFVYENDGVTLDRTYAVTKDIFVRSIESTLVVNQPITGEVSSSSIEGEVNSEEIIGTIISENQITGVVLDEC